MIFVEDPTVCRRRQSTYAVKAALEAGYAGIVAAGTCASMLPVMIKALGEDLLCRWGRNLMDRSTSLVKLVVIS